jgi:hypothetical protein
MHVFRMACEPPLTPLAPHTPPTCACICIRALVFRFGAFPVAFVVSICIHTVPANPHVLLKNQT